MASTGGQCAVRGSCGSKGRFGPQLPCPYDGPPEHPSDDTFKSLLASTCSPEFAQGPVCCTSDQVTSLRTNFQQVESIISSCPACRNNFREFYCQFTCSPNQASFITVMSTQKTSTGQTAVKSLDFAVSENLGQSFFQSCKDVKFGATNGYAMDFIGGGATNYTAFLQYMGDERPGLGSPFQIDYPPPTNSALDFSARKCDDASIDSRCACVDCPATCPILPPYPAPGQGPTCTVGILSCLTFTLILVYALAITSFFTGYGMFTWRRRRQKWKSERLALSGETSSLNGLAADVNLVGASSLASRDGADSVASSDPRLGRGMDTIEVEQPRRYGLDTHIRRTFYRLGLLCAGNSWAVLAVVAVVVGILNAGWSRFAVEVDPVRLWVPPGSPTKLQKEFFDSTFGPFYRTEQIFVTASGSSNSNFNLTGVLSYDRLRYVFEMQDDIRALKSTPHGYTLNDVCFKPSGARGPCVIQSISAWYGDDFDNVDPDDWQDQLKSCARNPANCLPAYGQPLAPQYILSASEKGWVDAEAMIITYVVSDSLDPEKRAVAEEWERDLKAYLIEAQADAPDEAGAVLAFSTGISLEEELNQSTNTDFRIVILSYLMMFLYISLTLGNDVRSKPWAVGGGKIRFPSELFVKSKFLLGLFGLILVIASISTSVGVFSFLGVKVTLIIAEVIPFLVLAVGVDNVFILVHELDRQNTLNSPLPVGRDPMISPDPTMSPPYNRGGFSAEDVNRRGPLPPDERVARTLAKMGPSILLSTITETLAFLLGALVPMPAVRNFALYAAGSVFFGALLQVTAFIAALAIDLRRVEANRIDCAPCFRVQRRIALPTDSVPKPGLIQTFIRNTYAPFLLRDWVRSAVITIFSGLLVASVISIQHLKLGLDQRLALPSESYLIPYFNALDNYLGVGPPVYFVAKGGSPTSREGQRHLCGRFTTCESTSLMNTLEGERKRSDSSFLAEPGASWLDDFFLWLDPRIDTCCRVRKADPSVFCSARDSERLCRPCFEGREPAWNITLTGLPEDGEFMRYVKQWLVSPTDEDCPLGGMASYGSALSLDTDSVSASHFRTFHTPLKSQDDYINALTAANRIATAISDDTGVEVFPYSVFYVFFEQYLTIVGTTQEILGLGLGSVLLVTALLLGSWRTGIIVTGVVALTVTNVMGVMAVWGISLNALSLVNLVISLGIAVEFCSHIARAYVSAGPGLPVEHPSGDKDRKRRVWLALSDVGPSVVSGITFTKLIGISVLALTRSKLLEIYYFRMWLTLIISGAAHGLVLLPVILSFAGGPGFIEADADEEWMSDVIRRPDQEYAPFRTDSDVGEDSD